jgi:hypothetical protein
VLHAQPPYRERESLVRLPVVGGRFLRTWIMGGQVPIPRFPPAPQCSRCPSVVVSSGAWPRRILGSAHPYSSLCNRCPRSEAADVLHSKTSPLPTSSSERRRATLVPVDEPSELYRCPFVPAPQSWSFAPPGRVNNLIGVRATPSRTGAADCLGEPPERPAAQVPEYLRYPCAATRVFPSMRFSGFLGIETSPPRCPMPSSHTNAG